MVAKKAKYNRFQVASALCMLLALLWLTISLPFVTAAQQLQDSVKTESGGSMADVEEDNCNPFSNTTEEKTPTSNSFSEEYLHDHHAGDSPSFITAQSYCCVNDGTYLAFHGELLVPPPDFI